MITKNRIVAVTVALLVTTSIVSASAFTTSTFERDSNIEIVSDSDGLLQLGAGDTDAVYENSAGELTIEMDSATASGINGVNPSANFTFGDAATLDSASSESSYVYAFNLTVKDDMTGTGSLTLSYTDDGNGDDNVQFRVYQAGSGAGTHVATATEQSSGTFSPTKGTTYYVVLSVDSGTGSTTDLTKSDNLDGTLTISVS